MADGSLILVLLAPEAMFLCHVVQVLAVHLRLARGGAHVAAVAPKEPLDVSSLEFGVELRPCLAVTLAGLELEHVSRGRAGTRQRHKVELGLPRCARQIY